MAISIFAKRAFLNTKPNQPFEYAGIKPTRGHLQRISSMIRGDQIAEAIGAKLNPSFGYKDDICIYVKPVLDPSGNLNFGGRKNYIDVVDSLGYQTLLQKHPEVSVIAISEWNSALLKKLLPHNEVVLIPQQHCNFERKKRIRNEITVVGAIGSRGILSYLPVDLEAQLHKRGIKLIIFSDFFTRQDIIDFYLQIDIQIVWRTDKNYKKNILMNSLKLANASSFGIPSICYDEPVFEEMQGCYLPVKTLEEFLNALEHLRNNHDVYNDYANKSLEKAENYHIDTIGALYKKLDNK